MRGARATIPRVYGVPNEDEVIYWFCFAELTVYGMDLALYP